MGQGSGNERRGQSQDLNLNHYAIPYPQSRHLLKWTNYSALGRYFAKAEYLEIQPGNLSLPTASPTLPLVTGRKIQI